MKYLKLFNEGFFTSDTKDNKEEVTKEVISIIKNSLLKGHGKSVQVVPEMVKLDHYLKDITKPMSVIEGDIEGSRNGQKFQIFFVQENYFLSIYNPKPGSLYTEEKPSIKNFIITKEQAQDFRNCMLGK